MDNDALIAITRDGPAVVLVPREEMLRLLTERTAREQAALPFDMTRALPGGMDDSTYEAIETALDTAEAPIQDGSRWLKLHERVAALGQILAQAREEGRREGMLAAAEIAMRVPLPEDCHGTEAHGRLSACLAVRNAIRARASATEAG